MMTLVLRVVRVRVWNKVPSLLLVQRGHYDLYNSICDRLYCMSSNTRTSSGRTCCRINGKRLSTSSTLRLSTSTSKSTITNRYFTSVQVPSVDTDTNTNTISTTGTNVSDTLTDNDNDNDNAYDDHVNSIANNDDDNNDDNDNDDSTISKEQTIWNGYIHPDLQLYIRSGFKYNFYNEDNDNTLQLQQRRRRGDDDWLDSSFSVYTIGSGSDLPCDDRASPSTVLRIRGNLFIINCGEGTQRQILHTTLAITATKAIFITSLHADNVYGLPGILARLNVISRLRAKAARQQKNDNNNNPSSSSSSQDSITTTINIYGPIGLYNFIVANLTFCQQHCHLKIIVHELNSVPSQKSKNNHHKQQQVQVNDCRTMTFPEFRHRTVIRKRIQPTTILLDGSSDDDDDDNNNTTSESGLIWKIATEKEVTTKQEARRPEDRSSWTVNITATELYHGNPNVQCFGYVFHEPSILPQNIDPDLAFELGITDYKKIRMLKWGYNVESDIDSSYIVHPHQVLVGSPRRPRKVSIIGDCTVVSKTMKQIAKNSNILIHSATMSSRRRQQQEQQQERDEQQQEQQQYVSWRSLLRQYQKIDEKDMCCSNATQAGMVANEINAHILVLNHLDKISDQPSVQEDIIKEATQVITNNKTLVQISFDFMQIRVPRCETDQFEPRQQIRRSQTKKKKVKNDYNTTQ